MHGLMTKFRCRAYQNEIGRMDALRTTSSWTYPSFFAVKEGLAMVYLQMAQHVS